MGKFVVIGLGSFGQFAAKSLMEGGHEVLVIDQDPVKVQRVKDTVSSAITANAVDKEFLREADIADVDGAIIAFGEKDMAASILATMYLKELGLRKIVVKAASEDHKIILEKIGATETVLPERDMAERIASRMSSPNVYDQVPLSEDYGILEVVAPARFIVKRLEELDMRSKHGVQVLFLRRSRKALAPGQRPQREDCEVIFPNKDTQIMPGDILILAGSTKGLEEVKKMKPSAG